MPVKASITRSWFLNGTTGSSLDQTSSIGSARMRSGNCSSSARGTAGATKTTHFTESRTRLIDSSSSLDSIESSAIPPRFGEEPPPASPLLWEPPDEGRRGRACLASFTKVRRTTPPPHERPTSTAISFFGRRSFLAAGPVRPGASAASPDAISGAVRTLPPESRHLAPARGADKDPEIARRRNASTAATFPALDMRFSRPTGGTVSPWPGMSIATTAVRF